MHCGRFRCWGSFHTTADLSFKKRKVIADAPTVVLAAALPNADTEALPNAVAEVSPKVVADASIEVQKVSPRNRHESPEKNGSNKNVKRKSSQELQHEFSQKLRQESKDIFEIGWGHMTSLSLLDFAIWNSIGKQLLNSIQSDKPIAFYQTDFTCIGARWSYKQVPLFKKPSIQRLEEARVLLNRFINPVGSFAKRPKLGSLTTIKHIIDTFLRPLATPLDHIESVKNYYQMGTVLPWIAEMNCTVHRHAEDQGKDERIQSCMYCET
jgi:hypothetical protein